MESSGKCITCHVCLSCMAPRRVNPEHRLDAQRQWIIANRPDQSESTLWDLQQAGPPNSVGLGGHLPHRLLTSPCRSLISPSYPFLVAIYLFICLFVFISVINRAWMLDVKQMRGRQSSFRGGANLGYAHVPRCILHVIDIWALGYTSFSLIE